jgi:hypothetical protein
MFDQATRTGMISCGDLGQDDPQSFALVFLGEALRDTRRVIAPVAALGRTEAAGLPAIATAMAPGRLTV